MFLVLPTENVHVPFDKFLHEYFNASRLLECVKRLHSRMHMFLQAIHVVEVLISRLA